MDKAPDAYRTISEVAEDLDLPQHVLRFWETRFTQIKPLKRGGGRRYYRPDDVELLKGIRHLLYREGYTIKGVQRILKEQGVRAVQVFARGLAQPDPVPEAMAAPVAAAIPEPAVEKPIIAQPPAKTSPLPVPPAPLPAAAVQPKPPAASPPARPATNQPMPTLFPMEEAIAAAPLADEPNPALENWRPELEEDEAVGPGVAITLEPGPAPPPPPQVSMFRGGLARGEGLARGDALAPTAPIVQRAPQDRNDQPATLPPDARAAMRYALEELVACRSMIDRVLARRQPA